MPRSTNSPTPLVPLFRPHLLLPLLLLQSLLLATAIPLPADGNCPLSQCISICNPLRLGGPAVFCNKTGCTAREICVDMQNSLCQPSLSRRDLPSVVRQTTPPPPPATDVTKTVQFTKSGDPGGGGEFTSAITNPSDPTASIMPPPPTPHSPSLGSDYNQQGHVDCEATCTLAGREMCNEYVVSNTIKWSCDPVSTVIRGTPYACGHGGERREHGGGGSGGRGRGGGGWGRGGGGWERGLRKEVIAAVVGGVFFGVAVVVIILMWRRIKRGRTGMRSGGEEGVNGVGGVGGEKYPVDTGPGELSTSGGSPPAAVEVGGADSGAEMPVAGPRSQCLVYELHENGAGGGRGAVAT